MFKSYNGSHFDFVFLTAPYSLSFQSLTGFLLVTTRDGKLVYISENVTEYLGHSMVGFIDSELKKTPIEQIKPNKINMNLIACFILKNSTITG